MVTVRRKTLAHIAALLPKASLWSTIALGLLMIVGVVLPQGIRIGTGYLVRDVQIAANA